MQRDHACDVEATKVQGHILVRYPLCDDFNPSLRISCLLGIWGLASQPLQCFCSPPNISLQRYGCCSHAHPSGMLTYIYLLIFVYENIYRRTILIIQICGRIPKKSWRRTIFLSGGSVKRIRNVILRYISDPKYGIYIFFHLKEILYHKDPQFNNYSIKDLNIFIGYMTLWIYCVLCSLLHLDLHAPLCISCGRRP